MNTEETTVTISLPESVKAFVEAQVAAGEYQTIDEYLERLILKDREHQAQEKLEALLLEGLDSGTPIPVTDEYWKKKQAELQTAYSERNNRK